MSVPKVRNSLAHHPPVNEQDRTVWLRRGVRATIKDEAQRYVRLRRNIEVECRHEEPYASFVTWQTLRDVTRCPF